jgi:hypothetical protein
MFLRQIFKEHINKAAPWLRQLVAGLSPWRPRFAPGSVHVGFVVDKMAFGQVFSPSSSVFPYQYHYTMALHAHVPPGG